MASSDVFVLTPTKDLIHPAFLERFPRSKIIIADELTEDVLSCILKRSLTKYFYVISPNIEIINDFDFSYVPNKWSTKYIHIWQDSSDIRLMSRKEVKNNKTNYTDATWNSNKAQIKLIKGDVFKTAEVEWPWYDSKEQGDELCKERFFFVKDNDVELVDQFNKSYMPQMNAGDKKHLWQRINPVTNKVYDYSGITLYPTGVNNPKISYVKEVGCISKLATVISVSDIDDNAVLKKELDKFNDNRLVYFVNGRLDIEWDFSYYPNQYDNQYVHVWKTVDGTTSVKLATNELALDSLKLMPLLLGEYKLYDVIYLSYNEPFADDNYNNLLKIIPRAKRVHGVKGIFNAHKKAAELATTDMFYVVDADAKIKDDFTFSYAPDTYNLNSVHVWRCENPINGLIYGYGGVKLFPTEALKKATSWNIDFTTSVTQQFKLMNDISNITAFNTDPYNTWKSAFRECVKLSSKVIEGTVDTETEDRLEIWCSVDNNAAFGSYALAGATQGRVYGLKHKNDLAQLSKINDFAWLQHRFNKWKTNKN